MSPETEFAHVPMLQPGPRRCLVPVRGGRCPHMACWSLVLECPCCLKLGSGPTCEFHKRQADEWGVPHHNHAGDECRHWALLISAVLI